MAKISTCLKCITIFLISTLLSCGSLYGGFLFDDTEAITNNKDVDPDTPWEKIFVDDFWGTPLSNPGSHKSYRPLTVISYRLNVLFGGFDSFQFHLTNVLIHGICCVLFYTVLRCVLLGSPRGDRMSFIGGILFAVHPVHTEAVSALVGRADLLCALFFYMSFLCYLQCANSKSSSLLSQGFFLLLALVFCGVAMLCKEQGITSLILCSVFDALYTSQNAVCRLVCIFRSFRQIPLDPEEKDRRDLRLFVGRQTVLFLGVLSLFFGRWWIMGASLPEFKIVDNPASFEPSIVSRILSYNYIYSLNMWILFAPDWLCFDWSMGCVEPIRSVFDLRVLAVMCFWAAIAAWLRKGLQWIHVPDGRILLTSFVFLVIPYLPASNLFFRVGFVIAERVLYTSVGGVTLLTAYSVERLPLKVYRIAVPLLILVYSWKSVIRTSEWSEETSLFVSGLRVCPNNAKVHYNIAKVAADLGNSNLAVEEYREAIRLNPNYDQAMNNLANLLRDRLLLDEAESLLERAVSVRPNFTAAWMNLGIVRASLKKYSQAEAAYYKALSLRKWYPDCYYNLGNLYLEKKEMEKAYWAFQNATSLQPTHALAWCNLIAMLDNGGKIAEALALAEKALNYIPHEPNIHFTMANAYGKAGKYQESEAQFLEAIRLRPNNAVFYANLGVLYHRWKRYDDAKTYYDLALQVDPNFQSAKENLQLLQKTMQKNRR